MTMNLVFSEDLQFDVKVSHLLHDQFGGRHPDGDALVGELVQDVLEVQVPSGLGPRESAALNRSIRGEESDRKFTS